jgi:glutamate racemase
LGVIRPTVEAIGDMTHTRHVGILATPGTVQSHSYNLELGKIYPDIKVTEIACPMWVPLVENKEATNSGADYFVAKYIDEIMYADPLIDTIVLACTHYPILYPKIRKYAPDRVNIISQGGLVGNSLSDYLQRHLEIASKCSKNGTVSYLTTENIDKFDASASIFMDDEVHSEKIVLR